MSVGHSRGGGVGGAGPGPSSAVHASAAAKKRPRHSLEEAFVRPDAEEKRRLGTGYQTMQSQAEDMKANLANISARDLTASLKRQSKLFSAVRDTGTAALDAKLLSTLGETAVAYARQRQLESSSFDVDEMLLRVKALLGRHALEEDQDLDEDELEESDPAGRRRHGAPGGPLGNWEKLGWMAAGLTRRVPGMEFMYGPLAVSHKKRTVARRARRRSLPPEERPQEIETSGKGAKDDTLANVRMVSKVLSQLDSEGTGVNLFRLVLNPESFGQTVENMFYLSFLVRDGRAGIEVGEDGEILVRQTQPHDPDIDGDVPKNQAVVELDVETWEDAKRVFDITESAIPHRVYEQLAIGANTWYA
ncbi:hypothetical protein JCM24511_07989 [Saitozyma sp. JCM 24511]|nr:hypothetical protein JCM24511_07989 [Saitozyma sp. JCM 24511]